MVGLLILGGIVIFGVIFGIVYVKTS